MSRATAYAALTGAVVFWGGSFVAMKVLLRELSPAVMVTARFAIGCAVLAATLLVRRSFWLPPRRDLAWAALLGAIGVTFHQWLQANGLLTSAASVSAWIVSTTPVFVAVLGWLVLREKITALRAAGILLAAAGMSLIVSQGDLAGLFAGRGWVPGDWLVLLSAANWAVFTILSKRLIDQPGASPAKKDRSMVLMFFVLAFGWLFCLPWLAVEGGVDSLGSLSTAGWWALGFLGIACSGLAYIFWYAGLERADATQVGAFLYLEPLVTSLIAAPVLGEPITASLLAGGTGILLGLWLVNRA
jgi:drug/metabolite transporter (DMT)-like permease